MYGTGRGPMGGHRGPGFGPGMGFGPMGMHRPMRMYRRMGFFPMGLFPMGGLFLLPGLMFGGWIAVAVVGSILSLLGSIIGGVFEGLGALVGGGVPVSVALGMVIGVAAYFFLRKRNAERNEPAGAVDGEEAEVEITEPATAAYQRMER